MDAGGAARIEESYALAPGTALPDFQYLMGRCATMDAVALALAEVPLGTKDVVRSPWVEIHLDSATRASGGSVFLTVSYRARLTGRRASVPVVMPMAPLAVGAPGVRPATVTLRLPARPGAHPLLPHLEASTPGTWTSRFDALPSAVRLDLGPGEPACVEPGAPGDAGTFGIRFAVFIATLALWIPLYFWWARRPDRRA